ncbi:hypothetical protein [Mucilaginibacter flavidus]|uniref:hypothetical protein n=1 Tax=Mucilaginibacter flavidus TaxID=2949309 RepID=UPI0020931BAB|nr:hypothetical protein [Mucilaginibacter flavidus]MCO5945791.1 hypothetical protein [Mucilaginibacter flavidus]
MKKISLILLLAGLVWTVQTAQAQTQDTTKNKIEIKKKVRKGSHGRTITKIKMTGTGTPGAINDAAESAVTGHSKPQPVPAPTVVTPPPPATEPVAPTVVVVHDTVRTPAPAPVAVPAPTPTTTEVTTTTETKPAVAANVSTHHVTRTSTTHKPVHTYHRTYKKTAVATPATKTTTTTKVTKTE